MAVHYAHFDRKRGKGQRLDHHLMLPADQILEAIPPSIQFPAISNKEIRDLAYWEYLFHDFGKYTQWFQDYVIDDVISDLKSHSFISACLTYSFLLNNVFEPATDEARKAFLAFICILRHHSSLRVRNILDKQDYSEQERLKKQACHLQKKLNNIFMEAPWSQYLDEQIMSQLLNIQELLQEEQLFWNMPRKITSKRQYNNYWYFPLLYLFSILIDTDKMDSGGLQKRQVFMIESDQVEKYLLNKHYGRKKTELVMRREKARKTIINTIDSLSNEEVILKRFYTLTAPTGLGKTLASLQAALKLQKRIKLQESYTPRIITAIPFINIIEQTKSDYEAIFADGLVVHHRLADFTQQTLSKLQEETPVDKQLMQVEAWEGQAILTTFVQLFHSLLTGANRPLKKINKLAGSIVILDEVQSIPYEKMPLIGALLQKVAEYYGTRFILMTATQPMLLEQGTRLLHASLPAEENKVNVPINLLPDYPKYFERLQRTRFIPCLETILETNTFCEFVLEKIKAWKLLNLNNGNNSVNNYFPSILIVVNTIQRCIDVFEKLLEFRKEKKFKHKPILLCLSTNLIPKHRQRIIRFVQKCLREGKPIILVSTQTIEAGVDVDFDIGFRDLAPLPALIQTTGRVNREGRKRMFSPVYIVQLEKDCSWVYSTSEMSATRDLLKGKGEILESQFQLLVETYYEKLQINGLDNKVIDIWNLGVLGLDFEEINKFSLIDNIGEVADVFIEYDDEAVLLAQAYKSLLERNINWPAIRRIFPSVKEEPEISEFAWRSILRLINARLNDYVVQLRVKKLQSNLPLEFGYGSNLFWVPKSEKGFYYSPRTGFKAKHEAFVY